MNMKPISMYSPRMLMLSSFVTFVGSMWLMFLNKIIVLEWELASLFLTPINITLMLDMKGMLFSSVVLFISSNVMSFSTLYMKEDKFIDRFTILVLLFVLSMNLLIYIPNMIVLLLGWDGLGIISFILVIYYQNPKSLAAGMITAMTNRIGDVMILLSIAMTLNQGHWNILSMWNESDYFPFQVLMILVAAMTKSAQMPFSSWLPAAMAAPTPVSALVHSSTLVTAGVFLLIRFYPFLSSFEWFNLLLLYMAMMTMTMAGLSATVECDMKKIIALSTLSQLGLMMCSLGFNLPLLAYFHMVVHAMFKALLFICAGVLIYSHMHSQDLRWMGNLINQMPMTSSCIMVANLAMSGFPFLAAFYTKDSIIEMSMYNLNSTNVMILLYLSLGITAFYSMRFSLNVLWAPMNSAPFYFLSEPKSVSTPMIMLGIPSIMSGMFLWWYYPFINTYMNLNPLAMKAPLAMIFMGFLIAWAWSAKSNKMSYSLQVFMSYMWYLTPISTQFLMGWYMTLSKYYLETVDQAWLEYLGGTGMHLAMVNYSNKSLKINLAGPLNYIILSIVTFFMVGLTLT
uniref:NADH-ubiquinone oxidoreductase chain 5 n=1 Tax=Placobdella lamothei TaxID=1514856 RepID=A0A175D757_9ANNE|nr:NADH dehydrogenase subunit 5 [Placobdella lamothei]CVK87332.1 NADH dehydrogenase subunit 5 [Placobdella lamothei]